MIEQAVRKKKMSISDFAEAINCSRTNVYSIFKRRTIDSDRLKQIADVLNLEVSDFIEIKKRESNKCVAIIEIDNEKLEQMSNEYKLTYVKAWKTS
jgi:DNA-binding Xre family transcriptional regulator